MVSAAGGPRAQESWSWIVQQQLATLGAWFSSWYQVLIRVTSCSSVPRAVLILVLKSQVGEVTQSCPTLCDPVDCSLPSSSVHGILQARILEWVAISFSRGSSNPGIEPGFPALEADALTSEPPGKLGKLKWLITLVLVDVPYEVYEMTFQVCHLAIRLKDNIKDWRSWETLWSRPIDITQTHTHTQVFKNLVNFNIFSFIKYSSMRPFINTLFHYIGIAQLFNKSLVFDTLVADG